MLSLFEYQQAFMAGLKNKEAGLILDYIQTQASASPKEQLAIYRNSIIGRFQKTLKTTYPVCHQLVGEDFFIGLANAYIEKTPSSSPDLNDYGNAFSTFITTFSPADSLPYLSDIARLEWAWHCLLNVKDPDLFDFQKFAAYAAHREQLIFLLPQQSTLLSSPYPIHLIWESNQTDFVGETTIQLAEHQTYYLLVFRHQHQIRIDSLSYPQWQILDWITKKMTLEAVCEKALQVFPEIDMATCLPTLIQQGWVTDFCHSEPTATPSTTRDDN